MELECIQDLWPCNLIEIFRFLPLVLLYNTESMSHWPAANCTQAAWSGTSASLATTYTEVSANLSCYTDHSTYVSTLTVRRK